MSGSLRQAATVNDNAANIVKAARLLHWNDVLCLAHTLN